MPVKRKVEDTKEFRDAWDAGVSMAKIGAALGVCKRSVSRAAARFGYPERVPNNAGGPSMSDVAPTKREGVRSIHVSTDTRTDIRKMVSVPAEPWADDHEPVSLDSLCRAWQADVLDYLKDGMGVEDIALKMECDVREVRFEVNRLRKNGILDAAFKVV